MSVDIMELVKGAVSKQVMGKIGGMLGTDEAKTNSVFDAIAGSVLGGLMKKAGSPGGNEAVLDAIEQQDTSILDQLGDLLGGGQGSDKLQQAGGGLLESVFGGDNSGMINTIAKSLGLDPNLVNKLIKMAAPIVMAVIGKYAKANSLDKSGVANLLSEQKSYLGNYLPGALTSGLGLSSMLGNTQGAAAAAGEAMESVGKKSNLLTIVLIAVLIIVGIGFVFRDQVRAVIKEKLEGKANVKPYVHGPNDTGPRPMVIGAGTGGPGGGQSNGAAGNRGSANVDLSSLGEMGPQLKQNFDDILSALGDVQDEAEAKGLALDITDLTGRIDSFQLDKLESGAPETAARQLISRFTRRLKTKFNELSDDNLKSTLQPAVDDLMKKLEPFTKQ